MKNKNNKKKLPRYDIGRSISRGYQQNVGIGSASFESRRGEDLMPEVNAMRANQIPNTIAKLGQNIQYPLLALLNLKTIPVFTSVPNAVANSSLQSFGNSVLNAGGSKVGGLSNTIGRIQNIGKAGQATNGAIQTGTRQVLNTAGKVAAGIGTAYGAYNVMDDIMHAGDTITTGLIANTRGTNTITTAGGNAYTEKTGADSGAAMEYERLAATAKKVGLTLDALGLGASIGGFFGPLGMGIGAAGGALIGGIASLLGFGDNEEEVERGLNLVNDATAMENRLAEGLAKNKDVRDAFRGNAANGKMPGFNNGKANARVSNGEIIGNFEDGYFRVPGSKNNKDDVKTHLGKKDFVISNKHGLSDYAWLTGDIPGALAALSYLQKTGLMNKYKNGKLPKFAAGTWDTVFSMIPHGLSLASNIALYNRAKAADTYAPDTYVDNAEGAKAVNELANLRYDARSYYTEALRGLNQANWNGRRQVALGAGGRAILQNANFNQYLNNLAKINALENEANAGYRTAYANALANLGARNQQLRMQSAAQKHQWMQQANAARENWMAQYLKNIDTNLLNMASEYMKWGQYNDAKEAQNKMLSLYQQQVDNDTYKAHRDIANLGNNTSTPITRLNKIEVPSMISRPSDNYGYIGSITNLLNGIQTPYTLQQNYKNWYNPQWGGIRSHKVR